MKLNLLPILFCLLSFSLFAQKDARIAKHTQKLVTVQKMTMSALDNQVLYDTEMSLREPGRAPRFAEVMEVDITPDTHGTWETLEDGNAVWRLRVESAGAKSLNLGFTKFFMPEEGTLILYTPDYEKVMGPFTPSDNEVHEQLWTPVLDGDELIIEVQLPEASKSMLELELSTINHDFLGFSSMLSGSCNLDVICGEEDGWGIVDGYRDIIRSVAAIGTGGGAFCTGFLVNNTLNDGTPYFMTANHCGINSGNASSLVAYWNFENSTCREPGSAASGNNGDGSLGDFNTGSIFRAAWAASDMTLVELDDPVSETAAGFLAGWSHEYTMTEDTTICVHHPSTDEKRITFEFGDTQPGNGLNGNVTTIDNATHIIVPDWDIGTTEPGSSGSPLFNKDRQVVGQLHGGGAACGNDLYDTYGWFYTSWIGGGTSSTRLSDWLDPNNSGVTNIPGLDLDLNIIANPSSVEICAPDNAVYTFTVSPNFTNNVDMLVAGLPDGTTADFSPNPVAPGAVTTLTVSNTGSATSGNYSMDISATDGTESVLTSVGLSLLAGAPTALTGSVPADGATEVTTSPIFEWDGGTAGSTYEVEVASDIDFNNILATGTNLTDPIYGFNGAPLSTETIYYWRIRASNLCGEGPWSTVTSFTTANIQCANNTSADVPVAISASEVVTVTSTLEITYAGLIDNIEVFDLNIPHTWVGDVSATLTSPEGTVVQLFDQPGVPDSQYGCSGDDIFLAFSDASTLTAADLETTCDEGPALGGSFQPIDALSAFNGESVTGTWTLSVSDAVGEDGGSVDGWSLFICSTIPFDNSITPSISSFETCVTEAVSFSLTVGNDFDPEVTLSASDVPAGSSVNFSQNTVAPGGTVEVSITGNNTLGNYDITINGTDGENNGASIISLNVLDVPVMASLNLPANGSIGQALSPTLTWDEIPGISSYQIEFSDNASFDPISQTLTSGMNSTNLVNLNNDQTVYWRVVVENICGVSTSEIFSFTTLLDLTFSGSPDNVSACATANGSATYQLQIGAGYDGMVNLTASNLPSGSSATFSENPATPGSTVTVTIDNLGSASSGASTITFEANDGTNSNTTSVSLTLQSAPAIASLVSPANASSVMTTTPNLSWMAVAGTDNYGIELATDAAFVDVIENEGVLATNYTIASDLPNGTYFWRVYAENDCGSSVSAEFSFTVNVLAADDLNNITVNILPNPTNGNIDIRFSEPISGQTTIDVFAVNGQLLQNHSFVNPQQDIRLKLGDYTAGIYLIRLVNQNIVLTKRVVLQK